MKKGSFFERLTGSQYYDEDAEDHKIANQSLKAVVAHSSSEEVEGDGQLTVDVYQTDNDIIIEVMIPAVKPDDLDISINRETVTLRGKRERYRLVEDDQFFFRELFWGSFSRTILLPQEIEPEQADAREKNGLLTITLPKSDKAKLHKIKVKSHAS